MLIEFRLKNFRSIKDEQSLSLVASAADKKHPEHIIHTTKLNLLRSAAIYGPNAAGKSNVLLGLAAMKRIIIKEREPDEAIAVTPYLFDEVTQNEPTEFEIIFISEGVRYQYGFSTSTKRIIEEWLFAYPKGRPQTLIQRHFNPKSGAEEWGNMTGLSGAKHVWQTTTRPNALFLKTAVNLNSQELKPVYTWFSQHLKTAGEYGFSPSFTIDQYMQSSNKTKILGLLNKADPSIQDLNIIFEQMPSEKLDPDLMSLIKKFSRDKESIQFTQIESFHKIKDKKISMDFEEESYGTKKMFSLAGPWLDVIENGRVLLLDEVFNNLHPLLVEYLLKQFHAPTINTRNAQLIFTTHDTSILNQTLLRRDQVWFVEKNKQDATELSPLNDFSPRKVENLEKNYLTGRYGAIPSLR